MEPVALGEGWLGPDANPYTEQGLLLRCIRLEFRSKRAFVGLGTSGLILTQHMLERTYERTEADPQTFANLLHNEIRDLLRGVALADAANLWIESEASRVTAIPFAGGLLLLNTRILFANEEEGELGFHFEVPRGRHRTPYVNANLLVDPEKKMGAPYTAISATCGVTYFNITTLNPDQMSYYYAFEALKNDVGLAALDGLSQFSLTPNLAHENWGAFELGERHEPRRKRAESLLRSGWLKASTGQPMACLLPYGAQAPRPSTVLTSPPLDLSRSLS